MADQRHAKAIREPQKRNVHRRCPSCGKTHLGSRGTQVATRINGDFPSMLRCYVEIDVKQTLVGIAQDEQITLSALTRKIIREWLAGRIA